MASGEMKYGILGEDNSTPGEKLAKFTGVVGWDDLKDHQKNGVLFFVDPEMKLEEAGLAVTEDDSEKVAQWLQSGDLVKIEEIHAAQWVGTDQQFEALVVSPFVFCRPQA